MIKVVITTVKQIDKTLDAYCAELLARGAPLQSVNDFRAGKTGFWETEKDKTSFRLVHADRN